MRSGSVRSVIAVLLFSALCGLPAADVRADDTGETTTSPGAAADDARSDDEDSIFEDMEDDAAAAEPGESKLRRSAAIGLDVLIVRPLDLATLIAGAGFVFPASVLAAPNSMSVREEVVDVLWTIPLENLTQRELGEI